VANFPYPIYGVITATDSSTPSTRVTLRNDRSGEKINVTSNTSGEYVLDAANFTNSYLTTDRVTVVVGYGDEEGTSSILLSSGTHEINITLSSIAESSDTTYCQPQDVLDELGDKTTSDISYERLRKIILRSEAEIDERSGTKFASTTVTDEYHDFDQYTSWKSAETLRSYSTDFQVGTRNDSMSTWANDKIKLKNSPILSITSLSRNTAGRSATDSWESLTEQTGSGGDFITNKDIGVITFVNNYPALGMRKVKTSYTYGSSTVPKTVERLCILLSVRDVLMSKGQGSQFDSIDNISLEGISISKGVSGSVSYFTWLIEEINRLWEIVGELEQNMA